MNTRPDDTRPDDTRPDTRAGGAHTDLRAGGRV